MRGISPLCREGILHDSDIVYFMYYDILTTDSEQLDLPLSPYSKFYINFPPLHPNDDPEMIIRTERERLKTFYSKNAQPQKEVRTRKRITKISRFGRKILLKYELSCPLFRYHIIWNKLIYHTIADVDFPAMHLNDVLTIVSHLRSLQIDDISIGAYHVALSLRTMSQNFVDASMSWITCSELKTLLPRSNMCF